MLRDTHNLQGISRFWEEWRGKDGTQKPIQVWTLLFPCKHGRHSKYIGSQSTHTHQSMWLPGLCNDTESQRAKHQLLSWHTLELPPGRFQRKLGWSGQDTGVNQLGEKALRWLQCGAYGWAGISRESNDPASLWSDCSEWSVESRP